MTDVYILRGGVGPSLLGLLTPGWDGRATSRGMDSLADRVRAEVPGAIVQIYDWGDFEKPRREIVVSAPKNHKVALIGYSGGGSVSTWICSATPRPRIDLLVLYDPSPKGWMVPVYSNVQRAICYENRWPLMAGLGGGQLRTVGVSKTEVHSIAEQHLLVQSDKSLHDLTIKALKFL